MKTAARSQNPRSRARVAIAFVIAPMVFPILAVVFRYAFWDIDFLGVFFGLGLLVGYGSAVVLGIPAYILFQKPTSVVRLLPYLGFALVCTVLQFVVTGVVLYVLDGGLALNDDHLWLLTMAFLVCAILSVSLFYLISQFPFSRGFGDTRE